MQFENNQLTHAIKAGRKQIGLWISMGSPFVAEVSAPAGFDWAVIDMEHSPNDYFTVLGQLQAFAASNTTAIVRPQWNDPVIIKRLLDLGVPGLLIPMVQSVEEAEKAVAATRYPPNGMRGYSGATRATKFGRITDYVERVEQETTVILQLESIAAIEQAVEIGSVEGVSGLFFGPADIAADMGYTGQPMHPDVWELIRATAQKLIKAGIPVGTLVLDAKIAAELLNEGFTFVASGIDASLLAQATDALLADVKHHSDAH